MTIDSLESLPPENVSYGEIISSIVKRFARLACLPAALSVARKIPQLTVDDEGHVLEFDARDPMGVITLLIDQYEVLYGEVARTLVRQAASPLAADGGDKLLDAIGLSDDASIDLIRILLVDDHILFREGMASLLGAQKDIEIVGQAGTVQDSIALARSLVPNLILMNMSLLDGTAVEATRAILADNPQIKIVVLTVRENEDLLFEAIRAGAVGYLSKNARSVELLDTLKGVMRGGAGISGTTARRILDEFVRLTPARSDESATLTSREVEVLRELSNGASNQQIAKLLYISENTVKNHVRNVLVKLHLHSRRDAAEYARRRGITGPRP